MTTAERQTSKRKRGPAALIALILVAAGSAAIISTAYQKTKLREAYLPDLEARVKHSPHDGALLALTGGLQAMAHDPTAASTLAEAIKNGEGTEHVYLTLASVQAALGDSTTALATLSEAKLKLKDAPLVDAAIERAGRSGNSNDPQAVSDAICPEGYQPLVDDYTQGSFLNGLVSYWEAPDNGGFATRKERAQQAPNDVEAQRLWGLALLRDRRIQDAITQLQKVDQLHPNDPRTEIALGQALDAGGAHGPAADEFLKALAIPPNSFQNPGYDFDAFMGLARASEEGGLSYTRIAYQHAVRANRKSVDACIGFGRASLAEEAFQAQAVDAFDLAAKLDPARIDYYPDYAQGLLDVGKFDQAEAIARKYVAAQPDDVAGHYQLGHLLLLNNPTPARLTEAESEMRRADKLSPHTTDIERQLGDIFLHENKVPDAIASLKAAVADNPNDVGVQRLLAQAYGRAGQSALALSTSKAAEARFALELKITGLLNQSGQRYLDPAYHRALAQLYKETQEPDKVNAQLRIAAAIQSNPAAFASSYKAHQDLVHKALRDDAVTQ